MCLNIPNSRIGARLKSWRVVGIVIYFLRLRVGSNQQNDYRLLVLIQTFASQLITQLPFKSNVKRWVYFCMQSSGSLKLFWIVLPIIMSEFKEHKLKMSLWLEKKKRTHQVETYKSDYSSAPIEERWCLHGVWFCFKTQKCPLPTQLDRLELLFSSEVHFQRFCHINRVHVLRLSIVLNVCNSNWNWLSFFN